MESKPYEEEHHRCHCRSRHRLMPPSSSSVVACGGGVGFFLVTRGASRARSVSCLVKGKWA
jgi:hypothetical protein